MLNQYIQYFDKDNVFLWISVHHVFQLLLTLLIMKFYFRIRWKEWGFNFKHLHLSLRIVLYFFIGFLIFQGVPMIIGLLRSNLSSPNISHALTLKNLVGEYAFQGLLSGTCEEPLFRGFAITILSLSWKNKIKIGKIQITVANIIAALLFAYAHIGFNLFPFEITRFYLPQIIYSFILGILYGIVFDRTKSLVGPILLHNLANVISIFYGHIAYIIITR
jgi:uncharacterized protein